jgi:hypothetical protein
LMNVDRKGKPRPIPIEKSMIAVQKDVHAMKLTKFSICLICMCLCIHTKNLYVRMYTHTKCVKTNRSLFVCVFVYVCTHVCMYVTRVHVPVSAKATSPELFVFVFVYVCMYVCMYV